MSGACLASWLLPYFFPLVPCRKLFELVAILAFSGHCSHLLSLTPRFVSEQLFLWPMLSWRREQVCPKLWCMDFYFCCSLSCTVKPWSAEPCIALKTFFCIWYQRERWIWIEYCMESACWSQIYIAVFQKKWECFIARQEAFPEAGKIPECCSLYFDRRCALRCPHACEGMEFRGG